MKSRTLVNHGNDYTECPKNILWNFSRTDLFENLGPVWTSGPKRSLVVKGVS